jgi:adenylate cyclase
LTEIPVDPDGVIRQVRPFISTPFGDKPSLSEIVRQLERGDGNEPSTAPALLNYYGRAETFPGYSFSGAVLDRSIPDQAFRDKIVIVGSRQNAGLARSGKDNFATPYTPVPIEEMVEGKKTKVQKLTAGMEIQATAIANLLEDRCIVTMRRDREPYLFAVSAFALAAAACLLSPLRGVLLCLLLGAGVASVGVLSQQHEGYHFLWTIPAFGQMPLIAGLSLGAHYLIEYSARWKLRSAFKSYMSDEQARQIDEDDVSLELGGKEVEVTILFSDLAGFTTMSEGLPPQSLSKALIRYFESATAGIMDNQGTIIKYIGDAVLATWGAPLKVDRECDRAINAAIQMQLAGETPFTLETAAGTIEQVLETRVGIHHGLVLAGNLGSSRRFDYTVVGDSVNTAARLEGLNKMLGTSILVSEEVLAQCADRGSFLSRRMGSYVLKGKSLGIVVHEILGRRSDAGHPVRLRSAEYLDHYRRGLEAFAAGDWTTARHHLNTSLLLHDREAEDPASRLMLDAMEELGTPPAGWQGSVLLQSK